LGSDILKDASEIKQWAMKQDVSGKWLTFAE